MTYVYALLVILVVGMVGYIYIQRTPGEFNKKKKEHEKTYSPVDEFLAAPEPEIPDEPKVISIGDFEAEKARRNKK